ncbi:hypothetical protein BgiMline_030421 [Biomphalaria glabrata]|nr:hypothetical protein BgiMline_027742 [Biomphalaria glabrata]
MNEELKLEVNIMGSLIVGTNLSSKQQIFFGNLLSDDDSFLFGIFMSLSFQGQRHQLSAVIYKSSLPNSDPLYCSSMSRVWKCQPKEIKFMCPRLIW